MSPGLVLNDRYRLLERLATGGMGEVWRAVDEALARDVAVKLLRQELMSDESVQDRFRSEAQYSAALRHGGIAQVYDVGEHDERAYLVMELVPGEPLAEILERTGGLAPLAALDLTAQVAAALSAAHAAGIVHRDVKPANLMVTSDGTVKITDFGIARRLAMASQTQTGMVMGTAHYISPEQASGQTITPAADLYSLGVVLFECLTGGPPFSGDTPVEIALKHVRDAPPPLPEKIPHPVGDLVADLLEKAPADRPESAALVAERALNLRRALATVRAIPGRQTDMPEFDARGATDNLTRAAPGQRRTALAYTSAAAGILLVGAIVAGSMWRGLVPADLVRDERAPLPSTPAGNGFGDGGARTARPATPPLHTVVRPSSPARRSPAGTSRTSTPGPTGASPSQKPTRKAPRATPSAPDPRPDPTVGTTTPSTPSPDPSPTDSGGLGSEDKV